MKSIRIALSIVLMSICSAAFAQSDAEKSFERLKALAGTWEGTITTHPPAAEIDGKLMTVTLRVTSMGNTLMHEMTGAGRPDDPITMFYLDGDRLELTHYGHMHGAVFTIVDESQHTEDWTFMRGDTPYHAHIELRRRK